MPYATYRFNKIIAAETIRFIVTVAIVVYKGLKLVVYRMLTKKHETIHSIYNKINSKTKYFIYTLMYAITILFFKNIIAFPYIPP